MHIEVNKKWYFAIALVLLAVGVVAYGSSSPPSTFGHSAGEMDITLKNGTVITLQQAINAGLLGGNTTSGNSTSVSSPYLADGKPRAIVCAGETHYLEMRTGSIVTYRAFDASIITFSPTGAFLSNQGSLCGATPLSTQAVLQ